MKTIKKTTIVFFGTTAFAVPILRTLMNDTHITLALIVSQPDRRAGRGMKNARVCPVVQFARKNNLPLHQPETLSEDAIKQLLNSAYADVFIVAAYGKIIPQSILDIPHIASLNLHGSILPLYRGASPIQSAILDLCTETGVSLMRMDSKMDHGPIYATSQCAMDSTMTFTDLEKKLATIASELLIKNLHAIVNGTLNAKEQRHKNATFTTIITREDGKVKWNTEQTNRILAKIRAYDPWPGCFSFFTVNNTRKRLQIINAEYVKSQKNHNINSPGTIQKDQKGWPIIATTDGAIRLLKVKSEGKKVMDGNVFLTGYQSLIGTTLE